MSTPRDVSGRLRQAQDAVRTSLWPVPVAAVALALVAGVALPRLDGALDDDLPAWLAAGLFGGDADAARTVLSAVASSLITVTSLTFSLTVVTLQLASSQFSPRLLRTFTRDRVVHTVLGLFLATFVFALTVLRTVRSAAGSSGGRSEDTSGFVPEFSVTFSFVLAVASVVALVLFLAHLAREIRVETTLRTVHRDASDVVTAVLGGRARGGRGATGTASGPEPTTAPAPTPPATAQVLIAPASGFLVQVDEDALFDAAMEHGAVVVIDRLPGDSLVAGTPIGATWSLEGAPLTREAGEGVRRRVAAAVACGFERTAVQDVALGLRQLTDVAVKALSPGINDPTTAVHALGHSSALLCELAGHRLGPLVLRDDAGRARAVLARPALADLLELAVAQPRRYGAADPDVLDRLFVLLREVAFTAGPGSDDVVRSQLERLRVSAADQPFDATERGRLDQRAREVEGVVADRGGRRP